MSADLAIRDIGDGLACMVQRMYESGILLQQGTRAFEKSFIECVLADCGGNKFAAARKMGMHRNTLDRHIVLLGIKYWHFNRPARYGRDSQRKQLYASKERTVILGGDLGRSALAPTSARQMPDPNVLSPRSDLPMRKSSAGITRPYSVRKGGRGESPEPSRGGREVATADHAHLAQSSKPPRGLSFADFQFEDPDLECGGLKA
jgi:hypothetical protein